MKRSHMPAGAGEMLQYLVHAYNDNTIRFIMNYPAGVDAARLGRAALALTRSVDVLHASFCAGSISAHWYVHDDVQQADCFTCLQAEDVEEAAIACALQPVALDARAQLHCTLVNGPDRCAVVLRISHLCVDGSDGKYLLQKLAEAYNTPDTLQVKNGNRSATQVYAGLSKSDMRSLMRSPLGGVKTIFPYETQEPGQGRMTIRTIPAQVMAAARGKAQGATVNDLLLTACYHALARTPGLDGRAPMSILGMMDLRRYCPGGDSPGLSNMVGSLGTTLQEGVEACFSQTLAKVAQQTRAAKENPLAGLVGMPLLHGAIKSMPLVLLQRVVGRVYGSFSVGLTNIGRVDMGKLALDGLPPTGGCFGGPLKKKRAMQVCAASFGGACSLCVVGEYTAQDGEKLHAFLRMMEEELAQFAAEP